MAHAGLRELRAFGEEGFFAHGGRDGGYMMNTPAPATISTTI
jgi:hypothetical protein